MEAALLVSLGWDVKAASKDPAHQSRFLPVGTLSLSSICDMYSAFDFLMDVVKLTLPVSNSQARQDALTVQGRAFPFVFQPLQCSVRG